MKTTYKCQCLSGYYYSIPNTKCTPYNKCSDIPGTDPIAVITDPNVCVCNSTCDWDQYSKSCICVADLCTDGATVVSYKPIVCNCSLYLSYYNKVYVWNATLQTCVLDCSTVPNALGKG